MRFTRILVGLLAVSVLGIAAGVRFCPSLIVLLAPDVKLRSPYCSVLKASIDGRIKLRQQRVAEEIARSSRVVRREAGLALWSTTAGQFWVPDGDDQILSLLLAQEERSIYGTGEWAVRRGDVVLDIGAYVGTWTKQALAMGAKLVVAVEPSPRTIECLRRNLRPEIAAGKVIIVPKGIWDSETALTLFAHGAGAGNSFVEETSGVQKIDSIPVTSIDKLAADLNLARIDFIKTDVKGASERLLRGGARVIGRDRPRLAMSTEEPADNALAIATLAREIQPAYEMKCGPCLLDGKYIYTDVLFFR